MARRQLKRSCKIELSSDACSSVAVRALELAVALRSSLRSSCSRSTRLDELLAEGNYTMGREDGGSERGGWVG